MTRKKNPFKVGDKVRCIEPFYTMRNPHPSGIYTIASVYGEYVGLEGDIANELRPEWHFSRFSLLERKKEEKTMTTYNPGDEVWVKGIVDSIPCSYFSDLTVKFACGLLMNIESEKEVGKHIPAPKPIVVGSKVTRKGSVGSVQIGTVLGINKNDVWVRWTSNFSSVSSKGGLKLLDD